MPFNWRMGSSLKHGRVSYNSAGPIITSNQHKIIRNRILASAKTCCLHPSPVQFHITSNHPYDKRCICKQVRVLAHLGCNVNAKDEHGRTPLMNCAMVDDQQWSVGLARTLLQHGAEPTATERTNGMSVMHLACILSQLELVRFLLKSAPDIDLRVADKRGNTPLHYAAAIGNHHIVAALLEACKHYQVRCMVGVLLNLTK